MCGKYKQKTGLKLAYREQGSSNQRCAKGISVRGKCRKNPGKHTQRRWAAKRAGNKLNAPRRKTAAPAGRQRRDLGVQRIRREERADIPTEPRIMAMMLQSSAAAFRTRTTINRPFFILLTSCVWLMGRKQTRPQACCFYYIGFARKIPDCFYKIGRAAWLTSQFKRVIIEQTFCSLRGGRRN